MQERISIHKLFLPGGLLLLAIGLWGVGNSFTLKGPAADQLHELRLQDVTNVTVESEIPGSPNIDNIWLKASNNVTIRYRSKFPYSQEVRQLDANYSLLLDSTNIVWAVKSADGQELARDYFEEYNIEMKGVRKVLGPFLAAFGALALTVYFLTERRLRTATDIEKAQLVKVEMEATKVRFFIILFAYMILYGVIIGPFLLRYLPRLVVTLLWVVSAAVLMRFLVPKRPPM